MKIKDLTENANTNATVLDLPYLSKEDIQSLQNTEEPLQHARGQDQHQHPSNVLDLPRAIQWSGPTCLSVCLKMVLMYYKINAPDIKDIHEELHGYMHLIPDYVSQWGFDHMYMKTWRGIGIQINERKRPLLVGLTQDGRHAFVAYGWREDAILLRNPWPLIATMTEPWGGHRFVNNWWPREQFREYSNRKTLCLKKI